MVTGIKRSVWADLVRIIAIYLVLLVHSIVLPHHHSFNLSNSIVFLSFALGKTSIPLFVMLSGALLLGKKETYKTFFSKRVSKLVLPWITWTFVYILFTGDYHNCTTISKTISVFTQTLQSFWFLPMIASLYLLTPEIRKYVQATNKKNLVYLVLLWFLAISFLPYYKDTLAFPLHVDNGLVRQVINYSGYFLLGYILVGKLPRYSFYIALLLFFFSLVWILFMYYFLTNKQYPDYKIEYISPEIILLSTSIFTMLSIVGTKWQKKISTGIKYYVMLVSSVALGVYFIHGILQELLGNMYKVQIYTGINSWINAGILFVIATIILISLQQIPFLKRFIS